MPAEAQKTSKTAPPSLGGAVDVDRRDEQSALLHVVGLTKDFPGMRALDGVDIQLRRGEIHALLGENGAGKSTLIKAIAGAHRPTSGRILIEGREVTINSPQEAQARGIAVVHQHSNLVPQLSVAENLFLGDRLPRRGGLLVNWGELRRRAVALLQRVGLEIDPRSIVGELRPDEIAMISIAKAIASNARVIILDEPTSAFSPEEVSTLFGQMRRLVGKGIGFLYVSHRLTEVFEIADRISVLRDGRLVGTWRRGEFSPRTIVSAIVGGHHEFTDAVVEKQPISGKDVLSAKAVAGDRVRGLDFTVHAGEILGFAGLPGSGAEEALDLLFGRRRIVEGTVSLAGENINLATPRAARRAGIALLPKDRVAEGILPGFSVRENISLPNLTKFLSDPIFRFILRGRERRETEDIVRRLSVKTVSIETPIDALSGGNQQKAMLGRWFATGAGVYLLNSPTAAVDVGAKAEIYDLIRGISAAGAAVIFTSTEVEEFPRVCQRVLVFHDGSVIGELVGAEITEEAILHLAVGGGNEH